jgi:hypothetical protein
VGKEEKEMWMGRLAGGKVEGVFEKASRRLWILKAGHQEKESWHESIQVKPVHWSEVMDDRLGLGEGRRKTWSSLITI